MFENEINPLTTVPDGNNVVPAEGERNDSGGPAIASVLSKVLGRQYKSDEEALNAVKQTYSYVGKVGQLEKEIQDLKSQSTSPATEGRIHELEKTVFYSQHPEYQEYADVIASMGPNPVEVVQTQAFKKVFEKASAYDKVEKTKSVLMSNPRIGHATDKVTESRQALSEAAQTKDPMLFNDKYNQAKKSALGAVLELNEIG